MPTPPEMFQFARANQLACGLYEQATQDYAAFRCCMLYGLFGGMQLGTQALEKLMKAFVRFHNPSLKAKYNHNIDRLIKDIDAIKPDLLKPHITCIQNFIGHYDRRYPDNDRGNGSMGTTEMHAVDSCMIDLVLNLPIPSDTRLRTGIFGAATMSVADAYQGRNMPPNPLTGWIREQNKALAPLLPKLEKDTISWLNRCYPKS